MTAVENDRSGSRSYPAAWYSPSTGNISIIFHRAPFRTNRDFSPRIHLLQQQGTDELIGFRILHPEECQPLLEHLTVANIQICENGTCMPVDSLLTTMEKDPQYRLKGNISNKLTELLREFQLTCDLSALLPVSKP